MIKLLLNANLSPETAEILRTTFEFDVRCLIEDGIGHVSDQDVAEIAHAESRIVITNDLDFGHRYHFAIEPSIGSIILRLEDQTVEHVNEVLLRFFREITDYDSLCDALVIVDEDKYRFYTQKT